MFCSELVAELYRRLDWLPRDIRAGAYVPGHFGRDEFLLQDGALSEPLWRKTDGVLPSGGKGEKNLHWLLPVAETVEYVTEQGWPPALHN
jgi:hypothetical protein